MILALDPGNRLTGWVVVEDDLSRVVYKGKTDNYELLQIIKDLAASRLPLRHFAIEMIASYGMSVGQEVHDTTAWVGRFETLLWHLWGKWPQRIYRREEKLCLCHSPKANDSTIRTALIDRFAYGVRNYGKGTKQEPGYFYGFKADEWAAMAVAVTYHDKYKEGTEG